MILCFQGATGARGGAHKAHSEKRVKKNKNKKPTPEEKTIRLHFSSLIFFHPPSATERAGCGATGIAEEIKRRGGGGETDSGLSCVLTSLMHFQSQRFLASPSRLCLIVYGGQIIWERLHRARYRQARIQTHWRLLDGVMGVKGSL